MRWMSCCPPKSAARASTSSSATSSSTTICPGTPCASSSASVASTATGSKSETVAIVNFITPGTVDADIYERCLWRIGVFQHAIGGSEEILGEITQELHDIAESFDLTPEERAQPAPAARGQRHSPDRGGAGARVEAGRTLWPERAQPIMAAGDRGGRKLLAFARRAPALRHLLPGPAVRAGSRNTCSAKKRSRRCA